MKPLVALWGGVGLFTLALSVAVAMLVSQQEGAATADASRQAQRAVARLVGVRSRPKSGTGGARRGGARHPPFTAAVRC